MLGLRCLDLPLVVLCEVDGFVDCVQYILLHQFPLSQHLDRCSVSVKEIPMLSNLRQLDFGHIHERIDLIFRPLKVLNTKGVDRHNLDTSFVANLQNLPRTSRQHSVFPSPVNAHYHNLPSPPPRTQDYAPPPSQSRSAWRTAGFHP